MKALLLKDYYVVRSVVWLYLAMVLIFQALPGTGVIFLVLYPALIPASAFAYDDRSRWGELAAMMPYSPAQIVLSRYVLGWICIGGFSLLGLVSRVLFARFLPYMNLTGGTLSDLSSYLVLLSAPVLFLNLSLPIFFRFDAEKSRAIRLLVLAAVCGIVGAGYTILGMASYEAGERSFAWVYGTAWILPLASLLLTAVSVRVSLWAYRARMRG